MKYQSGKTGRVFVVKFEEGENPLEELKKLTIKENLKASVFWLIGGIKEGRIVAGPVDNQLPPKPIWKEISENNEMLGIGTIFLYENEPRIHLHGVFGRENSVKMGCLREGSKVFLILEAIVMEILDTTAKRVLDDKSNIVLLEV